jgi:hypothetical protein
MSLISKIFGSKGKPKNTQDGEAAASQLRKRPPLWNGDVTVLTPDPPDRKWYKVTDYADAGPELRGEMEKIIAPLAQDPADIAVIRAYAGEQAERAVAMGIYMLGLCEKRDQISKSVLLEKYDDLEPRRKSGIKALHPYLGAAKEIIRRYKEEFIPAAQAKADASRDPVDAKRVEDIRKGLYELYDRVSQIESLRARSTVAIQALRTAIESPEEAPRLPLVKQMEEMRGLTAEALAAEKARADAAAAATVLETPMHVSGPLKLKPRDAGGPP